MSIKKLASQVRQEMFDTLAVNLAFYTEGRYKHLFGCPFCLRAFDSIEDLSDAHIFPKALGGRAITLACKNCNNEIGSRIESYEVERAKFNNAFSGRGGNSWKVLLSPNNTISHDQSLGKVTAEMELIKNEIRTELRFKVLPKGYDPKALDEITKSFNEIGCSINVEFQARAGWDRAKLTYLQSAFLFLFSQLGYEWVLDPCSQLIREQIKNLNKELIDFNVIEFPNSGFLHTSPSNQTTISWYLIKEPEKSRGFLIVFSGLKHFGRCIGVWMPLLGCSYQMPESANFRVAPLQTLDKHLSNLGHMHKGYQLSQLFSDENMV